MSPPPPPVPPRPFNQGKQRPSSQTSALPPPPHPHQQLQESQFISLDDTVKDLEMTTLELKNMAQKRAADNDEAIRQTAGAVREVTQVLLEAANHSDDDTEGYSEGAEDFSCGIEMPLSVAGGGNDPQSSGNVTPVQTLGELEDISVEEVELQPTSPRRTPLKSLLKKSFEIDQDTQSLPAEPVVTVRERSCSPRKAVHFSEVDQVKLMLSQESLVSTAPSDGSTQESQTVNATSMTCTAIPATQANCETVVTVPRRNQLAS